MLSMQPQIHEKFILPMHDDFQKMSHAERLQRKTSYLFRYFSDLRARSRNDIDLN